MKVAIIGSRKYRSLDDIREWLSKNSSLVDTVISGGARGVDAAAERLAKEFGLDVQIFAADWSIGRKAGILRNREIVDNADIVVAFWDGVSKGTRHAIGLARRSKKPLYVCVNGIWETAKQLAIRWE